MKEGSLLKPTYVYPEEVKMLMRSAFPEGVCDYPNPCHDQVSVTVSHVWYQMHSLKKIMFYKLVLTYLKYHLYNTVYKY